MQGKLQSSQRRYSATPQGRPYLSSTFDSWHNSQYSPAPDFYVETSTRDEKRMVEETEENTRAKRLTS